MRLTRFAKQFARSSRARRLEIAVVAIVVGVALAGIWIVPTPTSTGKPVAAAPLPAPGADASWPACKHAATYLLPTSPAFAIVGINDGEPGTLSACVSRELAWAGTVSGGSTEPDLAYYVMGADPFSPYETKWTKPIWPATNTYHGVDVPVPEAYGTTCAGSHTSAACAYVFGWTAAYRDAHLPGLSNPAGTRYWIDVEGPRDWSADQNYNDAIIEGMAAYFSTPVAAGGLGTTVGLYSTPKLWSTIVGVERVGSPLAHLDEWTSIGDGDEAKAAAAYAAPAPFLAGARVTMVQYWVGNTDFDYARPAPPAAKPAP